MHAIDQAIMSLKMEIIDKFQDAVFELTQKEYPIPDTNDVVSLDNIRFIADVHIDLKSLRLSSPVEVQFTVRATNTKEALSLGIEPFIKPEVRRHLDELEDKADSVGGTCDDDDLVGQS